MSSCIHRGLLYQSSEQGHDAGGGGRAHSQGPTCLSIRTAKQGQRWRCRTPAVRQAKSRPLRAATTLPGTLHLTTSTTAFHRRIDVNTLARLRAHSWESPPCCARLGERSTPHVTSPRVHPRGLAQRARPAAPGGSSDSRRRTGSAEKGRTARGPKPMGEAARSGRVPAGQRRDVRARRDSRRRRARDRVQGAHGNEPVSLPPPLPRPSAALASGAHPLSRAPGPCNLHVPRASPAPPYPGSAGPGQRVQPSPARLG